MSRRVLRTETLAEAPAGATVYPLRLVVPYVQNRNMTRRKRNRGKETAEGIAHGIHTELRSIRRQWDDLRKPLGKFEPLEWKPPGEPRYYVTFDLNERRRIKGLKLRSGTLVFPDERILDGFLRLAESVWHLKDRLRQWAKTKGATVDIEGTIKRSKALQVCADLANQKKHGRNENRSGLDPQLGVLTDSGEADGEGLVRFDTSKSGVLEWFYDGPTNRKELLVTDPVPIPYQVEVLVDDGKPTLGDAVELIHRAFCDWLPLIKELGILASDDRESQALLDLLSPLERGSDRTRPEAV